jgi:hypothetical protein
LVRNRKKGGKRRNLEAEAERLLCTCMLAGRIGWLLTLLNAADTSTFGPNLKMLQKEIFFKF